MKQIKILSLLLFILSVFIFGAYKLYEHKTSDNTPPVLSCDTDTITASVSITEKDLLEGVVAMDDVSRDVTSTLVIEGISAFTEENTRIITYAAIDGKGNVGRLQRTLIYTDYKTPTFSLAKPLRIPMGKTSDLLNIVSAYSILDGDLSNNVKYTLDNTVDVGKTGSYNIEFRVTDSGGYVEYFPTTIEVYDSSTERIEVVLSDYLIYLPIGAEFDPNKYYVGSDIDGTLSIDQNVNTAAEGIYYATYTVQSDKSKGISKLVVIVK